MSSEAVLGKSVIYNDRYSPNILVSISRFVGRNKLGLGADLPFVGADIWNCYELTWLNSNGKPVIAIAQIQCPAQSLNLIESKSLKLYLMGFAGERYDSAEELTKIIVKDLSVKIGCEIHCALFLDDDWSKFLPNDEQSICIDNLNVECKIFERAPTLLRLEEQFAREKLVSRLIRSLCPVTGQPDYASLTVQYDGTRINHKSLLQYICSLRNHQGFHEECCEMIFQDILTTCHPKHLLVSCNYTRRGGIDINPWRSTFNCPFSYSFTRDIRQ